MSAAGGRDLRPGGQLGPPAGHRQPAVPAGEGDRVLGAPKRAGYHVAGVRRVPDVHGPPPVLLIVRQVEQVVVAVQRKVGVAGNGHVGRAPAHRDVAGRLGACAERALSHRVGGGAALGSKLFNKY